MTDASQWSSVIEIELVVMSSDKNEKGKVLNAVATESVYAKERPEMLPSGSIEPSSNLPTKSCDNFLASFCFHTYYEGVIDDRSEVKN